MNDRYHVMNTPYDVHWQAWLTVSNKDFIVCIEKKKRWSLHPKMDYWGHRVTVVQQARELIYERIWKPEDISEIMEAPITWLRLIRL